MADSALGRVSVATNRHDGWFDNKIGNDQNDAESHAVRGQLLTQREEEAELLLKDHYSKDDILGTD